MDEMKADRQNILNTRRVLASQLYHGYCKETNGIAATRMHLELQEKEKAFLAKYGHMA